MTKKKSGRRVAPPEPSFGPLSGAPVHFGGSVPMDLFTDAVARIEKRIDKLEELTGRWDGVIQRQNRGVSEVINHFEDMVHRVDELERRLNGHAHVSRTNNQPIAVSNAEPVHAEPTEPTVEIGGQKMTQAQYNAARYPLLNPTPGEIDEAGSTARE